MVRISEKPTSTCRFQVVGLGAITEVAFFNGEPPLTDGAIVLVEFAGSTNVLFFLYLCKKDASGASLGSGTPIILGSSSRKSVAQRSSPKEPAVPYKQWYLIHFTRSNFTTGLSRLDTQSIDVIENTRINRRSKFWPSRFNLSLISLLRRTCLHRVNKANRTNQNQIGSNPDATLNDDLTTVITTTCDIVALSPACPSGWRLFHPNPHCPFDAVWSPL